MRYAKLSCVLNLILVIYSKASQLTYSLIGTLAMARRVIHMNKFCPSFCLEVFFELAIQFFLELNMVLGTHAVLCMTEPHLLKTMLSPKMGKIGQAQGSLDVYLRKFSFFSQFYNFFSVWSIMKVYITVIAICLNKFHIWVNSGS